MATIYYDSDANFDLLKQRTVAIIGYGAQGRAQALNLQDSGANVVVGLYEGSHSIARAEAEGLTVKTVEEASEMADVVQILIPDEKHSAVYREGIAPNMQAGNMLMVSHGFSVHFGQIVPANDIDVTMIAPKGPGSLVREVFEGGGGVPCLIAIHQDTTGAAPTSHSLTQEVLAAHALGSLKLHSAKKRRLIFLVNKLYYVAALLPSLKPHLIHSLKRGINLKWHTSNASTN